MTQDKVIELMKGSHSEDEWNSNCDTVKAAFGGQYPPFWYSAIVIGGLLATVKALHGW